MDEAVALAAAIKDAVAAEQAAREELAAAELEAHATSDDLNALTNAKKQAELRAKEKADSGGCSFLTTCVTTTLRHRAGQAACRKRLCNKQHSKGKKGNP
jgi:hypothetical protein